MKYPSVMLDTLFQQGACSKLLLQLIQLRKAPTACMNMSRVQQCHKAISVKQQLLEHHLQFFLPFPQ